MLCGHERTSNGLLITYDVGVSKIPKRGGSIISVEHMEKLPPQLKNVESSRKTVVRYAENVSLKFDVFISTTIIKRIECGVCFMSRVTYVSELSKINSLCVKPENI